MAIDRRRMMGSYLPLREAMERLFEGSFISPQTMTAHTGFPTANLRVTDNDVIIEMSIPGVNPEDVNVSVSGDTVTVSGEAKRERREEKGQTYVEEIWEGAFQRSFVLPFPVDAGKAEATVEQGILKLTLPKSEEAKPRKVQVSHQRSLRGQTQRETQGEVQKETVPSKQQSTASQKQTASAQKETASSRSGKSS